MKKMGRDFIVLFLISSFIVILTNGQEFGDKIESQSQNVGVKPIEKYKPQFIRVVKRRFSNGTVDSPRVLVDRRDSSSQASEKTEVKVPAVVTSDEFTIPIDQIPLKYQSLYRGLYGLPSDGTSGGSTNTTGQESSEEIIEIEIPSKPQQSSTSKPSSKPKPKPPTSGSNTGSTTTKPKPSGPEIEIEQEELAEEPTNATWTLNAPKGIRFHFSHSHDHKNYKPVSSTVNVTWNGDQPSSNVTWIKESEHHHHHHHKRLRKGHRHHHHRHRHHRHGTGASWAKAFNFTKELISVPIEWANSNSESSHNTSASFDVHWPGAGEEKPNLLAGLLNFVKEGTHFLSGAFGSLSKALGGGSNGHQKLKVQASGNKQVTLNS